MLDDHSGILTSPEMPMYSFYFTDLLLDLTRGPVGDIVALEIAVPSVAGVVYMDGTRLFF